MPECKHNLDFDTCSICLHPKGTPIRRAVSDGPRFRRGREKVVLRAQFDTLCSNCDGEIVTGDMIAKDREGVWVHSVCAD